MKASLSDENINLMGKGNIPFSLSVQEENGCVLYAKYYDSVLFMHHDFDFLLNLLLNEV